MNATTAVTVWRVDNFAKRDEEIDAFGFLEQRDQDGHAAHHHDHIPGHSLDGFAIVGGAAQHQHRRGKESAHADVDVEEDDRADERGNHTQCEPLVSLEHPGALGRRSQVSRL
jgi:hypothetical protein